MTAPTVSQYGPRANGARTAHFRPVGDDHTLDVQVIPLDEDDNELALDLARDLADHAAAVALRDAEIERLREQVKLLAREIRVLNGRVPPSAPVRLLGTGYVRFRDGQPWLMSKRLRGWAEFGIRCDSWDDLFRRYDVRVVGHDKDEHGPWWAVENGGGA